MLNAEEARSIYMQSGAKKLIDSVANEALSELDKRIREAALDGKRTLVVQDDETALSRALFGGSVGELMQADPVEVRSVVMFELMLRDYQRSFDEKKKSLTIAW